MPTGSLPESGKKLWEEVYQKAKTGSCANSKDVEACAAGSAWKAVKNAGWNKVGDKWVKRSDLVREFSMTITSVPFDKATGEMRWKAVASDTDKDLYDDSMSFELYKSFLDNIEKNVPPPEPFGQFVTSNWWKGGMPYLSVSHFPDLDGEAVPGKLDSIYVDGKCLKSKGNFSDTNLGRACWKALNKDFADQLPDDKRIRISIAFLDLAHKHADGTVFERKLLTDICKECAQGVGDKTYLKGYLVHLAMTRVPVNPRAEMEVEKSMGKKTREEDAASIIGEEEAKKIAEKSALVGRADILVEKADEILEEIPFEAPAEPPVVEDAISKREDVNPKTGEKKYGNVTFADEKNKKYPIDTEEHIRAAWNYINKSENAGKYSSGEVSTIKGKIIAAWKSKIDKAGPPSASSNKSDVVEEVVEVSTPTTVEETVDTVSIVEPSEPEKLPEIDNPNPPEPEGKPIDSELKALSEAVVKVMSAPATPQEKMAMVEPEIKNLGAAIERAFRPSEVEKPKEEKSEVTMEVVRSLIEESNKPVMDTLTAIQASLAELNRPTVEKNEVKVITPRPRSPDPSITRSLVQKLNGEIKPKSVLDICRTSVGLPSSND